MHRGLVAAVATVVLTGGTAACGTPVDTEPPVATPSVTLSRAEAPIGGPLDMTYRFVVAPDAPAFAGDYWVFVHFNDADGQLMWSDDHEPPTPTSAWTAGRTIEYTRTMFVPRFPYVGETSVDVGLVLPDSGERLPLAGESEGLRAYRVATFDLQLQSDSLFVEFRSGWHEAEASPAGVEWQWSRGEASLAFRNPGQDVVFYLQADQPAVAAFSEPQRVEIRVEADVVDAFVLPAGRRELRRVEIPAGQLGSGDTVEMMLSVAPTFVPASVPALESGDSRELGIRVFRAYAEPR